MKATWHLAKEYWQPYLAAALVALVVMGATAGLNAYAIKLLKPVFETIFTALEKGAQDERAQQIARLWQASWWLFAAFTAATLAGGLAAYLTAWSGQNVLRDLRRALFRHMEYMPMAYFERQSPGTVISRLSNDTQMLENTFSGDLANLVIGPLSAVAFFGLMVHESWRLSLLMFFTAPTVLVITRLISSGVRKHALRAQEKIASLSARIYETVAGIRVVRVFGLEQVMQERFERENQGSLRERMRVARLRALSRPASGILAAAAVVVGLVFGGREIVAGRVSAAGLMTFLFMTVQAGNYLGKFVQQLLTLQQAEGSALRVLELLQEEPEPPDPPDAVELEDVSGLLAFEGVSFGYGADRPVLEDFSLRAEPGEHVAIVGPSGAGKTTVANLAARLYDPDAGRVTVDGIDLRLIKRASYRRHVALVPQDTILFGGTVRENIAFGRLDATEEEIIEASKAAGAHEFVSQLPKGYDTELSDLGQNLSGGQRQRIAIARALLRRPRLLILDEATSALDRETEAAVQEALARLMADRTSIIIAHRLSTIKDADRIVVLLDGKVVEEGKHEELLAGGGVYYRLYHAQAQAEASGIEDAKG
ncbi:MAG: ABC transporter ATP-binding protein [Armatimonadota bacterium]